MSEYFNPQAVKPFTGAKADKAAKAAAQAATGKLARPTPMFTPEETGEERGNTVAAGQLRAFIERIERLEEDKKAVSDDIKEVYGELKGTGFNAKAVRTIVKMRKQDQNERQEQEAILELYKSALGMA